MNDETNPARLYPNTIRALARRLARQYDGGAAASNDSPISAILEPGITVLLGHLISLTRDSTADMATAVERFLDSPTAAALLSRFALGEDSDAEQRIFDELISAGARPTSLMEYYMPEALAEFVFAVHVAMRRSDANGALDAAAREALAAYASVAALETRVYLDAPRMETFVEGYYALGLGFVELWRAVAADGETVLIEWRPAPMAEMAPDGAIPAEEPAESAPGGDPAESEWLGESDGGLETAAGEPPPLPPPPAPLVDPAPAPAVALRLDAALPDKVTVGRVFDLAVAVRRPASAPLAPDDLTRRESSAFAAVWPEDAVFIQLRIQISAPDCEIHGGDSRPIRLLAGQDGPPVYFQLTPQRAGPLSIIITVYQELDWVGSTRLRAEAGAEEPRGGMNVTVESRPLGDGEVNNQTLWRALNEGYNEEELRDLCFMLSIDYDDLEGETRSAKARELVLYARRHDLTAALVEQVMMGRPHLLVE